MSRSSSSDGAPTWPPWLRRAVVWFLQSIVVGYVCLVVLGAALRGATGTLAGSIVAAFVAAALLFRQVEALVATRVS
jgi:hypothetical protein